VCMKSNCDTSRLTITGRHKYALPNPKMESRSTQSGKVRMSRIPRQLGFQAGYETNDTHTHTHTHTHRYDPVVPGIVMGCVDLRMMYADFKSGGRRGEIAYVKAKTARIYTCAPRNTSTARG